MRMSLPATTLLATLVVVGNVYAQEGWTSSSGTFGNRTLGSSISAGQRTFGSNPATGSRTTADLGSVGQLDSGDRFLRSNRQQGQFVGASSQDLQSFIGAVQANQRAGRQNRTRPTPNRPGDVNRPQSAQAGRDEIRASLHVAFPYKKTLSTELGTQLAERLVKMPQIHTLSPLEVRVADGTAILRGTVATDRDRDLAERLARLEPGIWKVNNELVVAGEPAPRTPAAGTPPASPPRTKPAGGSPKPPPAKPFLGGFFRPERSKPKGPATKAPGGDQPALPLPEEPLIPPELIPAD